MRISMALSLGACFACGCNAGPFVAPNPVPRGETVTSFVADTTPKLDLLFVIDNSGSMQTEQQHLRQDFKHMMEAFEQRAGVADLHIAVVSTDVGAGNIVLDDDACSKKPGGDLGRFRAAANCGLNRDAQFLISRPGNAPNFNGTLSEVFACVSDLGTKGCGYEHTLLSMRLALDEGLTPSNAGFLRADATLGIVFVTDEDDCSAPGISSLFSDTSFANQAPSLRCALKGHACKGNPIAAAAQKQSFEDCAANADGGGSLFPVQDFVTFIKGLKAGTTSPIYVSAIAGWPKSPLGEATYELVNTTRGLDLTPVCRIEASASESHEEETAYPALRLKRFIDAFGSAGTLESICNSDLRPALEAIGKDWGDMTKHRCLGGRLVDVRPQDPGLQANCVVAEIAPTANGTATVATLLPACAADGSMPCWKLVTHNQGKPLCKEGSGAIEVERDKPPAAGAQLDVRCESQVESEVKSELTLELN